MEVIEREYSERYRAVIEGENGEEMEKLIRQI